MQKSKRKKQKQSTHTDQQQELSIKKHRKDWFLKQNLNKKDFKSFYAKLLSINSFMT